ncbi:cytochrome P450 [Dendrothele bispora CBS 962.96]|uniref:Cytochrome P450 n=1 Tax=Dendrothele bispora (strain CBS 962.96) TaxID=1314807 RepID=A0A4S8KTZ4_DENBC|nr:cytochrome P450 [Dendrothele bispora CBS 962.96]
MDIISPFLILFLSLAVVRWYTAAKNKKYPPGPPAKPIIGNILKVPGSGAWYTLTDWMKTYGDLIFLHGLGNKVLVVNNFEFINDLFEKRWNNYSDRPKFTVAGELMELERCASSLLPYGPEWREHRRLTHLAINTRTIPNYHVVQEDVAAILNSDLLRSPEQFLEHLQLAAGRIVLLVTYGIFAEDIHNSYIMNAEESMKIVGKALNPGAYLADLIPILKYLPSWVPFQKEAQEGKEKLRKHAELPYLHVKKMMSEGIAPQSFTKDLLSSGNTDPGFDYRGMWVASTFATSATFILAMALNPEVQKRAQVEIDTVIGTGRTPAITDASELPYTMALIKETMRWHPPVPFSIPRRTTQDDIFNGYFIPKDTVVIPNLWYISLMTLGSFSRSVENPEQFNPDRYLNKDMSNPIPDPSEWVFGTGRRICPGRYLAENSLKAIVTGILSAFDILPPENESIVPNFTPTHISYPEPFKCRICPRSQEKQQLIETRVLEVKFT